MALNIAEYYLITMNGYPLEAKISIKPAVPADNPPKTPLCLPLRNDVSTIEECNVYCNNTEGLKVGRSCLLFVD